MAQQQENQEPTRGNLIRELQRINHLLDGGSSYTSTYCQKHEEEEKPFH